MPTTLSPDDAACVAALSAAGGDVDALTAAIAKSTMLDAAPGDGRQALRGECERCSVCCVCRVGDEAKPGRPSHSLGKPNTRAGTC